MSKVVSKIINKCNNSEEAKLNILIHQFDIDTELAISKTGHNFFRVQIDDSKDVIDKANLKPKGNANMQSTVDSWTLPDFLDTGAK